jgi:hypothetical protein
MSFWSRLRTNSASLIRMAAWPSRSSFAFALAIAALIVFSVAAVPYFWHTFTARSGQIIINSPTIYTRQRLVNDRLNQAEWLQQQLKAADGVESDFRSIDQVERRFESRDLNVAAAIGSRSALGNDGNATR